MEEVLQTMEPVFEKEPKCGHSMPDRCAVNVRVYHQPSFMLSQSVPGIFTLLQKYGSDMHAHAAADQECR